MNTTCTNRLAAGRALAAGLVLAGVLAVLPARAQIQATDGAIPRVPDAEEVTWSPLAEAASRGEFDTVRQLLISREGLDPDAFGKNGTAALHWTARMGDVETARWLVSAGADVNLANRYGVTPLAAAIENGHSHMVRWLLENGADPEKRDLAGQPPLLLAAALGDLASLDLLLAHGAGVDTAGEQYGQTALMMAVREAHPPVVQRLIEAGADVDRRSLLTEVMPERDGKFVDPSEIPGTLTQGVGIIRGGWPARGKRQPLAGEKTPLHYATRLGDPELTRMLVEAGADLEVPDANGITPLINAIINTSIVTINPGMGEHLKVAQYLVEAGADVNASDWYGQTPLWAAIDVRNLIYSNVSATRNHVNREEALELIRHLLDRGADPNARVREYPPSRHFILPIGSVEWVDTTGQTPFFRAALSGDVRVMKLLLDFGADPNIATFNGTTPLMAAAGVNWAVGQTYDEGPEALLEAVKLAHSLGNDVNAVNTMGLQAIHGAANRGSNAIIEYLAAHGAELDNPDNEGRTPINWAEGEYLPSRPLVRKPDTIALLQRLLRGR